SAPGRRSAPRGEVCPWSAPTARAEAPAVRSCLRPREGDSERDFVHVAPAPVLPRLERADDGVLGRAGVRRGMTVWRGVTAADMAAAETEAQMAPRAADAQAT